MASEQYQLIAGDWMGLERIINDLTYRVISQGLGSGSSPTFAGMTLSGLSGVLWANTGVVTGGAGHNTLSSLQGGTTDEYYHLTSAEYSALEESIYGSMYADNITHTVTVSAIDTFYEVGSDITTGTCSGVTFQNAKELKCVTAGKYLVTYSITAQTTAGDEWESGVLLNGTVQPNTTAHSESTQGATTRPQCNSGTGIITLATNDLLSFGVSQHSNIANIIVQHANMTILRIGA